MYWLLCLFGKPFRGPGTFYGKTFSALAGNLYGKSFLGSSSRLEIQDFENVGSVDGAPKLKNICPVFGFVGHSAWKYFSKNGASMLSSGLVPENLFSFQAGTFASEAAR